MSSALSGKGAPVTGASRGIGRAIALALARGGADVAVNFHRHAQEASAVCAEIERLGRRALAVRANVASAAEVAQMVESVERRLGGTDILVNSAGISRPQPLNEITERDWEEVVAVNLKSVRLFTQAVLPGMRSRRWGRIINPVPRLGPLAEEVRRITDRAPRPLRVGLAEGARRPRSPPPRRTGAFRCESESSEPTGGTPLRRAY